MKKKSTKKTATAAKPKKATKKVNATKSTLPLRKTADKRFGNKPQAPKAQAQPSGAAFIRTDEVYETPKSIAVRTTQYVPKTPTNKRRIEKIHGKIKARRSKA